MIDQNKVDEIFYYYAKQYYEHNGDLNVPKEFITNDGYTFNPNGILNLGNWLNLKRKTLNPDSEFAKQLQEIGLIFGKHEQEKISKKWLEYYHIAKQYYEYYGNLDVPSGFRTSDGITKNSEGKIDLRSWINDQRHHESIETEKGKLLLKIGMDFENRYDKAWNKNYKIAENYYRHYGNLNVPPGFRTSDGINKDSEGTTDLSLWIKKQRHFETPETERGKLLLKIGMDFENQQGKRTYKISNKIWNENYKLAENYYRHYGNLKVPSEFRTSDGINRDSEGTTDLGLWIINQRRRETSETERGKLLLKIGMKFKEKKDEFLSWNYMYEFAEKYYRHYGNLDVPIGFRTNDGYTYNKNGIIKLYEWLNEQKKNETFTSEKGKKLFNIGFKFGKNNEKWLEKFSIAKLYSEHYGNLKVPYRFITNDGYTYDKDGKYKLGVWINLQRTEKIEPGDGKWELLTQIGMIWSVNSRGTEIKEICLCNNINYDLNKNILKKMSEQELYSKIEFLKQNGQQIINERGILVDIFSMSSQNIKLKYGLSLEEIVNEYYINNIKGKEI